MKSIGFPDIFSGVSTNTLSDHEATSSNLKLLLLSDKTGLFGDPYYGTNLKKLLFDQNSVVLRDVVIDDIYTAITTFMPQIVVERKNITVTSNKTDIFVTIKGKNLIDYQTDLYNINLTNTEEM